MARHIRLIASGVAAAALSLMAAGAALTGHAALAQAPEDAITNPTFKGPEVIAFMGLKPGDKVADLFAGRFVRALSQKVGASGKVYAFVPDEIAKMHPPTALKAIVGQPDYANVSIVTGPINAMPLPAGLDVVFIRQNYHDLHDKFMGPADVAAVNKAVYAALKPGGVYVVLDHSAAAGSGLRDTDTIHRIDPATVKAEVTAAGFKVEAESQLFSNPSDDRTKMVFDKTIRGQTDQFLIRFKKPG